MDQIPAVHVTGSGHRLVLSTYNRHVKGARKQPSPRLAAYRVSRDTLIVKVFNEPRQYDETELPDLREIVAQRSKRLAKVSPNRPLELPLDAPETLALHVPGLQRVARIVSESFLVARLAVKLFGYVGFGWRWICAFLQLLAYAWLLMPGFLQMVAFYFFSKRVIRGVRYGPHSRNMMDIYVPPDYWEMSEGLRPVVVYVTGGAWTIGYKAWGALLSRRLSQADVMVCCLDYRNFPQGTALDMIEDINHGMSWVFSKIMNHGGDPDQVYICGQSCGGHLASLAILTQAEQQGLGQAVPGGSPSWDVGRVRAFIGVSGVYNVHDLVDHFDRRGLYKSLFLKIMSIHNTPQLKLLSPVYVAAHSLKAAEEAVVGHPSDTPEEAQDSETSAFCAEEDEAAPLLMTADSADLAAAEKGLLESTKSMVSTAQQQQQQFNGRAQSASALHGLKHLPRDEFAGNSSGSLISASWAAAGTPACSTMAATVMAAATDPPEGVGAEALAGAVLESRRSPAELMPHMLLLHGDADRCAPVEGAEQFAHALCEAGVSVTLKLLKDETHTSPLLENPMRGGKDEVTDTILSLVNHEPEPHSYDSLCPHHLIWLASKVCPF